MVELKERVEEILGRVGAAASRSGRAASDITLVAVSKTKPLEMIISAAQTGLVSHFGENRVQEGQEKIPAFPAEMSACWHLIGHLQRNKARKALELFDIIESLDSQELAAACERICSETDRHMDVLIEVNSSKEASKTGAPMESAPALLEFALKECPHLSVQGLMTVGPLGGGEKAVRQAFASVRALRSSLEASYGIALPVLSMGMSGDFEWAIEEGSTEVRIGSSIFGHR
ncbi:MAG: YggS family pyridoxal phosphate-dependent enzyme [Pyramidobacter sp.]|nr:YggS family pyridoxal phosphate-dependent enzyme [Pyramidobacter sp.]